MLPKTPSTTLPFALAMMLLKAKEALIKVSMVTLRMYIKQDNSDQKGISESKRSIHISGDHHILLS